MGNAAIRGTSGQLSVRVDPVSKVATGAVNMATGTVEFSDKEEEVVVEVVAGEAAQAQATEEGEKVGEIEEYVAPPVIVEEVKEVVEEVERLVEEAGGGRGSPSYRGDQGQGGRTVSTGVQRIHQSGRWHRQSTYLEGTGRIGLHGAGEWTVG